MTGPVSSEQLELYGSLVPTQEHKVVGTADLSVHSVAGITALHRYSSQIDRLNLASTRPNPFLSAAFLQCYALRMEYYTPGTEERLFLVWDNNQLIGCAPMRLSIENLGIASAPLRFRRGRLQLLAVLDTERPGILSAPQDAERVAKALIRHICDHERGWGMLEFAGQLPGTALHRAVYASASAKFRAREIKVEPYNEITVIWKDLPAYFRSLAKKMRSNISRQARRLFKAGELELIFAEGASAVTNWFEAYCELDARSWKHGTAASIQRHPRRKRFYQEIVGGNGGLDPSFIGVILDGVLIAGLIGGSNATAAPLCHGSWCLEMAYDQSRADLGPGQMLLLLAVARAIEKGHGHLNFMQSFAYYKHRWGAEPIHVVNLQLIRRVSLHNLRASLGELRKRLRRPAKRRAIMPEEENESQIGAPESILTLPDQQRARDLCAGALAYAGSGMSWLNCARARAYLPFETE